jgi:uncharacterized protein YaaQ
LILADSKGEIEMKRRHLILLIVLVIGLAWGMPPTQATPARALVETDSATGVDAPDLKQAIDGFVANADRPVGAEEIVSFLNGEAETAASPEIPFGPVAVFNHNATYEHIAAARLTDRKFVVAYSDWGNSGHGTAIVGQVTDSTITYGAEYVFNTNGAATWESVAALSKDKFVVAYYRGEDDEIKVRVGQVSGTVIAYGPQVGFGFGNVEYVSVAALSGNKFVVAYRNGDASNGMAVVGQVTGTSISYGAVTTFNSADTAYVSVAALSDTKFVVAYQDVTNSWHGTAIVGEVAGTSISYGSETVFNASMTSFVSVAALSSAKFVVAYRDGSDNWGKAIVGQVAGKAISYGSEAVFSAAYTFLYHSGGVARLSDTTFVVGYENVSDSDGRVVVGAVAGDDITFGNQVSYNAGSSSYDVTVVPLSASQYVVAWDDESDSDYGKTRVGTLPAFGSPAVFNTAGTYNHIAAVRLTDCKFVVAYTDWGQLGHGTAVVGQVSGTTVTYGAEYVFNAAYTSYESVATLSDTKFVVAYKDNGNSGRGTAVVGQVSGTTITYGAEYVFNAASTSDVSAAALSDTKFVVAYQDTDNSDYGTAVVGQVAGTIITYGAEAVFNAASTSDVSTAALSDTKFVVAYRDAGNSDYGTAVVGQVAGTTITYGAETVFNSAATYDGSVAALSATKFVVVYLDVGSFGYGTAIVGQVAGTTITYGSEIVFNAALTQLYHSGGVMRLSDTTFVVGYENDVDSDGRVVAGSVLGYDITFGHDIPYNAGSDSSDVTVVPLTESQFAVAWRDQSNSDYGTSKLGMLLSPSLVYLPLVLKD